MTRSYQNQSKVIGLFIASFFGSLFFIWLTLPIASATTINVNANIQTVCGNGILETGETCDGSAGAGNCYNNSCKANCSCPVCGNGTIEVGEACEQDSDCATNYSCNTSCLCQNSGVIICTPTPLVCSWGACVNGVQSGVCTNGCVVTTPTQSCAMPPVCGDGVVNPGEECDDHNIISGDGCSAVCQLEQGCGNGVIDPGEQCDDNNTASGDCCSATCQTELLISGVSSIPANTSSIINWLTQCQTTQSILAWGLTTSYSGGSISGLAGTAYSQNISGINPNTVYFYKITSSAGILQSIYTGSFTTAGGTELCNNGIDDDHNGFCDYPASTCSDGSTSGDDGCACTPNFSCTHSVCDQSNNWTMTCVDSTAPKCQSDYQYQETCNACDGVVAGPCQQVDPATCNLVTVPNCCGNGTCEPPTEDPYSCQVDCHVDCLSNWQCDDWQPLICPVSGIQTRNCVDRNGCAVPINRPPTQQVCGTSCTGLSCRQDQTINLAQCTCEDIVPYCGNGICENGETHTSCLADCIELCSPNWTCPTWGVCSNGLQTRQCNDLNNCNLDRDRPPEIRSCAPGCDEACTLCQNINLTTCSCQPKTPCCGNGICEDSETSWSCPTDCALPPDFRITLTACLDGHDNDGDGLVDFPADPGCTSPADNSELNLQEVLSNIEKFFTKNIIDNPVVEQVNAQAAPMVALTVTVNTFASFSFFNFATYLQYFFTQPFAVLFRRRRKKWGTVYNSLTKQPVDLAIVRLYSQDKNRLIQSRVTDKQGRYNFLTEPGTYYITVTKPRFDFPTNYLKDDKEDVKFLDLYHGEEIVVTDRKADIVVNIPLDPQVQEKPAWQVIFQYYLRKIQYALAFASIPLAIFSVVISPSALTWSLLGLNCVLYIVFRRLGYQRRPKNWGIVYDKKSKKPLGRAITRIYDKKYNKLLETRLTDARGRYSFLVNNNIYYVTAEKLGYEPTKTGDIDLLSKQREALVGADIPLARGEAQKGEAAKLEPSVPREVVAGTPVEKTEPPEAKIDLSSVGVSRESLADVLKAKASQPKTEEILTDPNTQNIMTEIKPAEVKVEPKVNDVDVQPELKAEPEVINETKTAVEEQKPVTTTSATESKPESRGDKSIFG
ncbi:MAG: DUF4215 domain-containing protein [Patescibacteria group bacterium]|nr:DUF4215 domain-containing protein [Patescibacteria group bacterium]